MSFKAVDYLIFGQQRSELDAEILAEFSPFLVTKSFSFLDGGTFVDFINDSLNVHGALFKNKEEQFKFFDHMIPRQKRKRINYIKKPKAVKEKEAVPVPIPEFYSKREIDLFETLTKYPHE